MMNQGYQKEPDKRASALSPTDALGISPECTLPRTLTAQDISWMLMEVLEGLSGLS